MGAWRIIRDRNASFGYYVQHTLGDPDCAGVLWWTKAYAFTLSGARKKLARLGTQQVVYLQREP